MSPRIGFCAAMVGCAALSLVVPRAHAQEPVPGEKWRQSSTMEMNGMKLPGQTVEMCVPIAKREEALATPPDNCEMYDMKQSGNRFSAKMRCTGKNAGEGSIESIKESADTVRNKMQMTLKDGGMTMSINSVVTKLPGSCDAGALERKMRKAMKDAEADAAAYKAKICRDPIERMKKDPYQTPFNITTYYPMDGGGGDATACEDPKAKAEACKFVGTRAGFWSLDYDERNRKKQAAAAPTALYKKQLLRYTHAFYTRDCGYGDVATLQKKLAAEAEPAEDWGFLIRYAPERADVLGKQECSGRGFTDAKNPKYKPFCARWGLKFARSDSIERAALDAPPGAGADTSTSTAESSTETNEGDAATAAAPATTKDKAKDAAQKAKKALRSIFGGG